MRVDNVEQFRDILEGMGDLYERKNEDYGGVVQVRLSQTHESFCVAFFKKRPGCGATPRISAFFGSFLRLLAQKRTELVYAE